MQYSTGLVDILVRGRTLLFQPAPTVLVPVLEYFSPGISQCTSCAGFPFLRRPHDKNENELVHTLSIQYLFWCFILACFASSKTLDLLLSSFTTVVGSSIVPPLGALLVALPRIRLDSVVSGYNHVARRHSFDTQILLFLS